MKKNNTANNLSVDDKLNLLLEHQAVMEADLAAVKKRFSRYIMWSYVATALKIIFILGPIIIAFIYLPPLISNYFRTATQGLSPLDSWSDVLKSLR